MKWYFVIMLLLFPFFYPRISLAEEIQSFDTNITIEANGLIDVSETIDYDFGQESRHGIFRTIPFVKTNQDNKKFKLDFTNISVSDQFSKSFEDSSMTLKIGDPNKTITGTHSYTIGYTVIGALTYFSDHDELYWNVTGNDWPVSINAAGVTINLPEDILKQDIRAECFTGPIGNTAQNCDVTTRDAQVHVSTNAALSPDEGLTIVVGFPKGIVAVLEPKPYGPSPLLTGLGILVASLWYIVYPISLPIKWWKYGRDPRPAIGETKAWFDAPKTRSLRSLTPGETGALIDERVDLDDICATIVDLARREYLKIIENKKNDFTLSKQKEFKNDSSLMPFESLLLEKIFTTDIVHVKELKLASDIEKIKESLYESFVTEGFFPKNPQKIRSFYEIIRVLSLMTFNVPLFLSSLIFGTGMPVKTPYGSQQAAVARSLRNFLVSQEKKLTHQAKNQLMFEKLLPYAIAFNVERIWAKRFEDIAMQPIDWYSSTSYGTFNSSVFVNSLNSSLSAVRSAATPTRSSSGFSSGFSGGSSGGGGGGGGGGSW
ncbi:hypothetical protein A3A79_03660 [Candidatus Gottesmanbacteria bacterium RIFCSPLOWO2_01_FULL_43_11b]|uniref:DUF2207 domain-containing protein n=1 Tax=Candidatus Gottesmanbacteria bacterium RIFCSPLOWO2_01_FULL_43_11b TaxID=1798392 RepID=A0A1F6AIZ9_9BACT|nr:MAG: hypothetical protein A3A79_03660 [Candidatus Gottesmanbacteria bacterium RIFCSPLOWO2_01_FULL_43_11b]